MPGDGEKGFAAHGLAHALGELVDELFALFVYVVFDVKNFLSLFALLAFEFLNALLQGLLFGQGGSLAGFALCSFDLFFGVAQGFF